MIKQYSYRRLTKKQEKSPKKSVKFTPEEAREIKTNKKSR